MITKIKNYWNSKSLWTKISDIIFVVFIVALLFPQGRLAIGGGVNRVKALFMQPSIEKQRIELEDNLSWDFLDINGKKINLTDYAGKVKFINLWATWCPPCIGEMPEIQGLYNQYKDNKEVVFLMVSDENISKISTFISKKKYTFPVFQSISDTPVGFRSNSIPTTFILSKDNKIVSKTVGSANWSGKKTVNLINELIAE
jgi:thiol-disulfide isomerase/thioredoxin